MKYILLGGVLLFSLVCCHNKKSTSKNPNTEKANDFAIIIHGGAGTILKSDLTPELEKQYREALAEAIQKGYKILKSGGSSIDAVEQTIRVMEDSPLFNAGKGAVFTHNEKNELDASIMYGKDLNAGAVAGVTDVKNPISLARKVMQVSSHVMLSGKGASSFAKTQGLKIVDPSYFYTDRRFKALQRIKREEKTSLDHNENTSVLYSYPDNKKFGTVGCVALDRQGDITAGTSTGGMTNKRWGRIGDSPIIGAGTYANNNTCGVSSTGWGEYFIRAQVAHDISALIDYKGLSLEEATKEVIEKVTNLGGRGGVIAIDKYGHMEAYFNTSGMYRATIDDKGNLEIDIYKAKK